jgi:hypothetical protein
MVACLSVCVIFSAGAEPRFESVPKPRLFVLTDIENEPDDAMSLVRLLTYSNEMDIEALVATTSCWQRTETAEWRIQEIVDAYGKVRKNLAVHADGYPSHDYLKSIIMIGVPIFGMAGVGEGHDSQGSGALIAAADRDDDRPLWVSVWGGANVLAQALWRVQQTRTADEVEAFVSKLRVYTISDQDDTGPWMRKTFPNLFYVATPGYEENHAGGYHFATWVGISGDEFHGRFQGADFELVDNPWLDEHIRKDHGPLSAEYPGVDYLMEGDTPSYFHVLPNGLTDPEHPNWGGWGGRYELYTPAFKPYHYEPETRPLWTNAVDEVTGVDGKKYTSNHATIWRWRKAYQNDFAARIDWSNKAKKADANHNPVAGFAGNTSRDIVHLTAKPGETVELSAEGSSDPDGDTLSYKWIYYYEAGTSYGPKEPFGNPNQRDVSVHISEEARPGTLHFVLEVKDDGEPSLYSYRRVIVETPRS